MGARGSVLGLRLARVALAALTAAAVAVPAPLALAQSGPSAPRVQFGVTPIPPHTRFAAGAITIRAQPSARQGVGLATASDGAPVRVVGRVTGIFDGPWLQVQLPDGRRGYVLESSLRAAAPPPPPPPPLPPRPDYVPPRPPPAPPPPVPSPRITSPRWLSQPSYAEIQGAYPVEARRQGRSGRATFDCVVGADNRLTNCRQMSEQPGGFGFGAAARSLLGRYRLASPPPGVNQTGAPVQVSIAFDASVPPMPRSEPLPPAPPAPPPPRVSPPSYITNPRWLQRPTSEQFIQFYPDRALQREQSGRVVLDCVVFASGRLSCRVQAEDPPGWGFGQAALNMVPFFQMAPATVDGRPTSNGRVRIPINFTIGN